MADEDCSFANQRTENMNYCPDDGVVGGIKVKSWYCPMDQLQTITKPVVTGTTTYAARPVITALTPKADKGFKKIILLTEENELKSTLVGNKGNKKPQASLDAMIPNFTKRNVGAIDANKNTPMCWVVEDSEGQKWVLLEAFMDKADGTTGKKYEDNSGFAITITANSKLYAFDGVITEIADGDEG